MRWESGRGQPAPMGFSAGRDERVDSPFSGLAFMAVELTPGAPDGVEGTVRYPPPFGLA